MKRANPTAQAHKSRASVCRCCGGRGLAAILDLGAMPLSDGFLNSPDEAAPRYPLELAFCESCALVQILETVPPEVLFADDYPYYSSYSDSLLEHSRRHALELIDRRGLDRDSLVIELASNDGYMLRNFVEAGIPVLGIDPAGGPVDAANARGVKTMHAFFTSGLARILAADGRRADVVIANNVLAHVADTNGFVGGIRTILKEGGAAVLEFPYVRDLIEHCEFDTIYHEHLCYFSLHAVDALFRRHGLFVNDVRRLPIHGGSLRITAETQENPSKSIHQLLEEERKTGLTSAGFYRDFAMRVESIRAELRSVLMNLRQQGASIAGYGAAAKGTILLNYIGADRNTIEFVVDRNVHKQGKWIPGVNIPIFHADELVMRAPDYAIILPWNIKDEIMAQQSEYHRRGGRWIVPIPRIEVV